MFHGVVSYPQAYFFIEEGAEHYVDSESKVPYACRGREWVSYEDSDSIREKVRNLHKLHNLYLVLFCNFC